MHTYIEDRFIKQVRWNYCQLTCFIVTCSICRQQVATFLHGYIA